MVEISTEFKPDVFFDVHSGKPALIYPFAESKNVVKNNVELHKILQHAKNKFAKKALLGPFNRILYPGSGVSIDWF